jgi:hypothetical protein
MEQNDDILANVLVRWAEQLASEVVTFLKEMPGAYWNILALDQVYSLRAALKKEGGVQDDDVDFIFDEVADGGLHMLLKRGFITAVPDGKNVRLYLGGEAWTR